MAKDLRNMVEAEAKKSVKMLVDLINKSQDAREIGLAGGSLKILFLLLKWYNTPATFSLDMVKLLLIVLVRLAKSMRAGERTDSETEATWKSGIEQVVFLIASVEDTTLAGLANELLAICIECGVTPTPRKGMLMNRI